MAERYMIIPKCIFPTIPYSMLIELRCDVVSIYGNFVQLAALGADLDAAFMHFDSALDEIEMVGMHYDTDPDPKLLDIVTSLTELYGVFYAEWNRLVGDSSAILKMADDFEVVYIDKILPDRYILAFSFREH